ncbi:MAG TPA: addiction module antidote protein [Steroidobacteraceae bacterium]
MLTGKTTKPVAASVPFRAADHLRSDKDIAAYVEAMLIDGDARAVPIALRTIAEALGGMGALAEKTGLSRETLYRTLSEKGNPRLDTLTAILGAFGLRLSVRPARDQGARRVSLKPAHA